MYNYFKEEISLKKHQPINKTEKINEARNYLIDKIKEHELMIKNHKKVCTTLNYAEHSFFGFCSHGCVLIFDFYSLVSIPIGITSSAVEIKIWKITSRVKKYKSLIKKKLKKHDKTESLSNN